MISRVLVLAGGLAGGGTLAQFPEFSQQYVQRLGGAVDALEQVVADFDASAASLGLTREAALSQMTGTDFVERRRTDMERTFARHERLSADLTALDTATPFVRAAQALRFTDRDLAQDTWAAFRPALPATTDGLTFAVVGFASGAVAIWCLLGALRLPFRPRLAEA